MGDVIALIIVGALVVVIGVTSFRSLRHRNRPIDRPTQADPGVTMHWISRHDDWLDGGN